MLFLDLFGQVAGDPLLLGGRLLVGLVGHLLHVGQPLGRSGDAHGVVHLGSPGPGEPLLACCGCCSRATTSIKSAAMATSGNSDACAWKDGGHHEQTSDTSREMRGRTIANPGGPSQTSVAAAIGRSRAASWRCLSEPSICPILTCISRSLPPAESGAVGPAPSCRQRGCPGESFGRSSSPVGWSRAGARRWCWPLAGAGSRRSRRPNAPAAKNQGALSADRARSGRPRAGPANGHRAFRERCARAQGMSWSI